MPRGRRDEGLSLVELSVAMLIVSVVAVAVGTVTIGSLNAARTTTVTVSTAADARLAMEAVSRTLRVAVVPERELSAIPLAKPDAVTFYALLNRVSNAVPAPTMVEYYRDPTTNCLMQATTPATQLTPATATDPVYAWTTGRTTTCVVRTAEVPSAANPWFSYYTTGALRTGGTPVAPITPSETGLTLAVRQSVVSVEVNLTVTDPAQPAVKGVSNRVRVNLSNVALANGGSA